MIGGIVWRHRTHLVGLPLPPPRRANGRWRTLLRVLSVVAIATVALTSWGNTVLAAGGPESQSGAAIITPNGISGQDPKFVALKKAFRVHSGVARGQAKGTPSQAYISTTSMSLPAATNPADTYSWGNCSNCSELSLNNWIPGSWEPGASTDIHGNHPPNFGSGTPNYDDARNLYTDQNFYDLCGPGAADVALWYWPWPPNFDDASQIKDPWNGAVTTWDATDPYDNHTRARGYMAELAWKINPGNKGGVLGLMQGGTGTTDTRMRDGLNWEASGENPSDWSNYFYVLASGSSGTLQTDVEADIGSSNVPVVLLVNAAHLPNWPSQPPGTVINHYITIVGYNNSTGQYAYTDTCGHSTLCGSNHDGGVNLASQSAIYNATYEWVW